MYNYINNNRIIRPRGTCEEDLAALETAIETLTSSNVALRTENKTLTTERDKLRSDLKIANDKITSLNSQIVTLNGQIRTLTTERDKLRSDLKIANTIIANQVFDNISFDEKTNIITIRLGVEYKNPIIKQDYSFITSENFIFGITCDDRNGVDIKRYNGSLNSNTYNPRNIYDIIKFNSYNDLSLYKTYYTKVSNSNRNLGDILYLNISIRSTEQTMGSKTALKKFLSKIDVSKLVMPRRGDEISKFVSFLGLSSNTKTVITYDINKS
jgi:hypothetical protein